MLYPQVHILLKSFSVETSMRNRDHNYFKGIKNGGLERENYLSLRFLRDIMKIIND